MCVKVSATHFYVAVQTVMGLGPMEAHRASPWRPLGAQGGQCRPGEQTARLNRSGDNMIQLRQLSGLILTLYWFLRGRFALTATISSDTHLFHLCSSLFNPLPTLSPQSPHEFSHNSIVFFSSDTPLLSASQPRPLTHSNHPSRLATGHTVHNFFLLVSFSFFLLKMPQKM